MAVAESMPAPPAPVSEPRPKNGLGVAALVLGVASLVAAVSFLLFPLALIGGLVGIILGIVALAKRRPGFNTNRGQALAGLICSIVALLLAITLSVRVGVWAAHNRRALTSLETCLNKSSNEAGVKQCFATFVTELRG
jgi:membrane-bound ClpP family serine protease